MTLIKREDAIEAIQNAYCKPCKERGDDYNEVRCRACEYDNAIIQIDALSSATLPMNDLISREDAIEAIKKEIQDFEANYMHGEDDENFGHDIGFVAGLHRAKTFIRSLPSSEDDWIPCSERLPSEREWIGTKSFGTTKSDTILMTFDVDGTRFVKSLSLQNGKLSRADAKTMDAFYKGWKMLAWMPYPMPYRKDGEV